MTVVFQPLKEAQKVGGLMSWTTASNYGKWDLKVKWLRFTQFIIRASCKSHYGMLE